MRQGKVTGIPIPDNLYPRKHNKTDSQRGQFLKQQLGRLQLFSNGWGAYEGKKLDNSIPLPLTSRLILSLMTSSGKLFLAKILTFLEFQISQTMAPKHNIPITNFKWSPFHSKAISYFSVVEKHQKRSQQIDSRFKMWVAGLGLQ